MAASGDEGDFVRNKHINFFKRCLQLLPGRYASLDTNRVTVAFFAVSGLDLLNALDEIHEEHRFIIEWIYSMQIIPDSRKTNLRLCGFRGSSTVRTGCHGDQVNEYDSGHIAMTYTALCILLILGDDLSRVSREGVIAGLRGLQLPSGSFRAMSDDTESDMRFVYCACCISHILDDWSGIDLPRMQAYIRRSLSYSGAFGQGPNQEAHGGSTFCAVASLVLSGRLSSTLPPPQTHRLRRWCALRQLSGFQGRPNKPVDTCYSFWVGATLELLGAYQLTDRSSNRSFLMQTQHDVAGGFAKWPHYSPDALHAYFGVCGLSLLAEPGVKQMDAALNVSRDASSHLTDLHAAWRCHRLRLRPADAAQTTLLRRLTDAVTTGHGDVDGVDGLSAVSVCLLGLAVQDSLQLLEDKVRRSLIDWIYTFQVSTGGFQISVESKTTFQSVASTDDLDLRVTHCALRCLLLLQDDLSGVNSGAIVNCLQGAQCNKRTQCADMTTVSGQYLSVCVSHMLNDWRAIDHDSIASEIELSLSSPVDDNETFWNKLSVVDVFCAIATLSLLGRLQNSFTSSQLKNFAEVCRKCYSGSALENEPRFVTLSSELLARSTLKMLDGMSEESSEIGLPSTDVTSIDSDDKDLGFLETFDRVYRQALQTSKTLVVPLVLSERCGRGDLIPHPQS